MEKLKKCKNSIEMTETHHDHKIYCCSNNARSETRKLAALDIILSLFNTSVISWGTYQMKMDPQGLQNMTSIANYTLRDVTYLIKMDPDKQDFFLSSAIIWFTSGLFLGILLFYGAHKKIIPLIKLWMTLTLVQMALELFALVFSILYLDRKVVIATIFTIYYLYKSYELWISFSCTKEINSQLNKVSDSGEQKIITPGFVVESPKSETEKVFTISGNEDSLMVVEEIKKSEPQGEGEEGKNEIQGENEEKNEPQGEGGEEKNEPQGEWDEEKTEENNAKSDKPQGD